MCVQVESSGWVQHLITKSRFIPQLDDMLDDRISKSTTGMESLPQTSYCCECRHRQYLGDDQRGGVLQVAKMVLVRRCHPDRGSRYDT